MLRSRIRVCLFLLVISGILFVGVVSILPIVRYFELLPSQRELTEKAMFPAIQNEKIKIGSIALPMANRLPKNISCILCWSETGQKDITTKSCSYFYSVQIARVMLPRSLKPLRYNISRMQLGIAMLIKYDAEMLMHIYIGVFGTHPIFSNIEDMCKHTFNNKDCNALSFEETVKLSAWTRSERYFKYLESNPTDLQEKILEAKSACVH